MDITVSEKYLWFPVDMSGEMVWVSVYDGDQKIQEMKVSLGKEHIDFYGVWKTHSGTRRYPGSFRQRHFYGAAHLFPCR